MSEKIKRSIENLTMAHKQLTEYLSIPIENNRDRSGIIKAFEFTFELVWKTMQKIAQEEGLEVGGPKSSIKMAFKLNFIHNDEESVWLQMLDDRNLMSHTYREQMAKIVVERIQNLYQNLISEFIKRLQNSYQKTDQ